MFSVSTSVVLLVFFVSQALGQTTSTVASNVNPDSSPTVVLSGTVSAAPNLTNTLPITSSATFPITSSASAPTESTAKTSEGPTTSPSIKPTGQNSSIVSPSVTPAANVIVSSTVNVTVSPSPSSAVVPSSSVLGTPCSSPPPSEKTCAKLSVVIDKPWDDTYKNSPSNLSVAFSSALEKLYNDSAKCKEVSEVQLTEQEDKVFASAKLCLVFKERVEVFIEDVFKNEVATGNLDTDLPVKKDSAEFKPLGVLLTDWKAKDGECEDKCEGAAGPFSIVRECENETYSCKGHKKTKKTDECTTYCSSTVAVAVSSVILVIGIFLSSSFQ